MGSAITEPPLYANGHHQYHHHDNFVDDRYWSYHSCGPLHSSQSSFVYSESVEYIEKIAINILYFCLGQTIRYFNMN